MCDADSGRQHCFRLAHAHTQGDEAVPPPLIEGFAGILREDWDAVLAGMTLAYSSGVVEGHVNRLTTTMRWVCRDGRVWGGS